MARDNDGLNLEQRLESAMNDSSEFLLTLGGLLLLGLGTDAVGRLTRLPRVTLLLILGLVIGPEVLNWLTIEGERWFAVSSYCALSMVGFVLGHRFTLRQLRHHGKAVLSISIVAVLLTAAIVTGGLYLLGASLSLAILLGGIATATDPAATMDVINESEIQNEFSNVLVDVVAIDDAWGLLLFSCLVAIVGMLNDGDSAFETLAHGAWEVGGAFVLGGALGFPGAWLTGRIRAGEPTLLEALGIVFLCGGLAIVIGVSPLLASMVMGATIANFARHHTRPFHAIEDIERPFLILFFVLAGASLRVDAFLSVGFLGCVYVLTRIAGRIAGGWLGSKVAGSPTHTRICMGMALMPQAGVALGLALIASERFPQWRDTLLTIVIGTTVLFELLGPLGTRWALVHSQTSEELTPRSSRPKRKRWHGLKRVRRRNP